MRSCHPLESFGDFWENGLRCIQLAEGGAFRFCWGRIAKIRQFASVSTTPVSFAVTHDIVSAPQTNQS
jgi:hypothetical protein